MSMLSYAASACIPLAVGFYLGAHFGVKTPLAMPVAPQMPQPRPSQEESDEETETENKNKGLVNVNLSSIKPRALEPCKLVLIVRTDLKMTPGKIAAQCGHATLACYKALVKANPELIQHWERTGQAKIALRGSSEEELLELEAIAMSLDLCACSILDAGRTQIAAGSRTVLGIGPAPVELVNQVTGHLKLL